MQKWFGMFAAVLLSLALAGASAPAEAQFGKLKDKVKQKAKETVEKKIEGSEEEAPAEETESAGESGEAGQEASGDEKGDAPKEMALYTKYDFVPGDKVIFYDDLSREEMGEFPSRWNLDQGVFEITRKGDRNWIMCSDEGSISPKVAPGVLPPKYTIEWDILPKKPDSYGVAYGIEWIDAEGHPIGGFHIDNNTGTRVRIQNKDLANKMLPELTQTVHTMRVMATKTTLKCFVDNERVANIPAVAGFQPVGFRVNIYPGNHNAANPMLIGTLRYAEGGKTLKEQLDEAGRIVTHGILFDSGSSKIKPESYKTLAEIGALLAENPALRLSIEGHTDSDGADDSNLKLSEDRAAAARAYLVETYKVDGGRLETRGFGESTPIDTNDTPEGKANNRRVELVKL
jgi:outer membrane protein OmpA-like peptidoglycan-associated protein